MKHIWACIGLAALVAAAGCENADKAQKSAQNEATSTDEASSEGDGTTTGPFVIEAIKVNGSQATFKLEGAPKPDELEKKLRTALEASPAFTAQGPRKVKGTITYEARPLPSNGGWDVVLLGGFRRSDAMLDAGVNFKSTDEGLGELALPQLVDRAVEEFSNRIIAQARVVGASAEVLTEILRADEHPKTHLLAIQEIRERKVAPAAQAVRPFLSAETPAELRTAAAAALVAVGDEESRPKILAVAEDFSRDRNAQFLPLLQILADMGGSEVETYLGAVAEGHASPEVRMVAEEALKTAKSGKTP